MIKQFSVSDWRQGKQKAKQIQKQGFFFIIKENI